MISTSRSVPVISSGLCFLAGVRRPVLDLDRHRRWTTQKGQLSCELPPSEWSIDYDSLDPGRPRDRLQPRRGQVLIQAWRRHYTPSAHTVAWGYRSPAREAATPPLSASGSASLHLGQQWRKPRCTNYLPGPSRGRRSVGAAAANCCCASSEKSSSSFLVENALYIE